MSELVSLIGLQKQEIKRLKVENKRLLEIINNQPIKTVDIDSAFEIEKLRQENQELKTQLNQAVNQYEAVVNQNRSLQQELNDAKCNKI